ncbi:MAG: HEPN domain-containing protein [Spirochaetaceae bacterium]
MAEKFLKQYELLLKKAKVDLKVAKNIFRDFIGGDDELDLEVVMFHLQQSTEKTLKSILDFNKIKFPRTHDIEVLINVAKENDINYILLINTHSAYYGFLR